MAAVFLSGTLKDNFTLKRVFINLLLIALLLLFWACAGGGGVPKAAKPFKTENVIVVVIDGPRHSENWGNTPGLIPFMSGKLKSKGTYFSDFQNNGYTYTNSGHVAITTGVNQPIDNYGDELPANPSYFQHWLKKTGSPANKAWMVMSKDKLYILANTTDSVWHNQYMPSVNAGVSGPGSGYRMDSATIAEAKQVLARHRPNLMLINLMEPDGYAHAGNWDNYLRGIARSDKYVEELWDYIRKDKHYKKTTALLITNDHGRHLDGIDGGWMEHGDDCAGCRRISLLAVGPDFNKRKTISDMHSLVDIPATIAPILGIKLENGQGKVIRELFRSKAQKRLDAEAQAVQ